jgi:hypothetical protein
LFVFLLAQTLHKNSTTSKKNTTFKHSPFPFRAFPFLHGCTGVISSYSSTSSPSSSSQSQLLVCFATSCKNLLSAYSQVSFVLVYTGLEIMFSGTNLKLAVSSDSLEYAYCLSIEACTFICLPESRQIQPTKTQSNRPRTENIKVISIA